MKVVSLVALATLALIGATACQDAVTSPQLGAELRNGRSSTPPPPPVEETASGAFVQSGTLSITAATVCPFSIPVKFMYNPKENNGWVHFIRNDGELIDNSNGAVQYKKGDFTGHGTLEILVAGCGLIVIDLSSVQDGGSFFCSGDQNCFQLFFDEALLYPCGNTSGECDYIEGTANMEGGEFED